MEAFMDLDKISDYIFNWMLKDIKREIEIAKSGKDAGNVLCALGLMAYTEFMGSLMPSNENVKYSSQIFNEFLRYMGKEYSDLLDVKKINVYDHFRCGLAHEYFIKNTCTIAMLNSTEGKLKVEGNPIEEIEKPVNCGIIVASNGNYLMVVEKYYDDLFSACERLIKNLRDKDKKWSPPKFFSYTSDSG